MGSQSVTNFTTVKMNRIRDLVRDYSPGSSEAVVQAERIGAAAVGTLRSTEVVAAPTRGKAKGREGAGGASVQKVTAEPTSDFEKAVKSPSVEAGLRLILTMIERLKKDPDKVLKEAGTPKSHALLVIRDLLKQMHEVILTKAQLQTESAFAANEAIARTIIQIVQEGSGKKEAADVDWTDFVNTLNDTPQAKIIDAYYENVIASLINLVLDASRGRIPPAQVERVKQSVREHFVPKLKGEIKVGPKK